MTTRFQLLMEEAQFGVGLLEMLSGAFCPPEHSHIAGVQENYEQLQRAMKGL